MFSSMRLPLVLALVLFTVAAKAQTPICEVQGAGANSPYNGQTVTIEGIVTAVHLGANALNGFYVEEHSCDADATTSNGIFVYAPSASGIAIGQRLRVVGLVEEYNGLTEITDATITQLGSTGSVEPTDIVLPIAALDQWERYEGMLLRFPGTLTVTNTEDWLQYGEITLAPERLKTPTDHIDPNDAVASGTSSNGASNTSAIVAQNDVILRSQVRLDDARTGTYPFPLPLMGAEGTLRTGSTVTDLHGVLHYSFGNYRLQPVGAVPIVHQARPSVPIVGGTIRAASLNVLNYWTTLGGWGAQNSGELARQRTKLLAALQALDADVYALHELENNDMAWADLLVAFNAVAGGGTYAGREENAFGSGGTKSVIFYRTDILTPLAPLDALNGSPFQRPHLTQAFTVNSTGGRFLFSTAHMRSKLCDNATGDDLDQGDGQGCFNGKRREQAMALVAHWSALRSSTGIEAQLIMGDLNSYSEEDPLDVLRASGLQHLGDVGMHSYTYNGEFGTLDHAFVTAALVEGVTGAAVWNINSDEPEALDYADDNLSRYQPNAFRCSDHDPVLIGIDAAGLTTAIATGNRTPDVHFSLINGQARWTVSPYAEVQVELYDALGNLIWRNPLQRGVIAHGTDGYASGLYLWRAVGQRASTGRTAGRFVVP